jgi:hypothetical protein
MQSNIQHTHWLLTPILGVRYYSRVCGLCDNLMTIWEYNSKWERKVGQKISLQCTYFRLFIVSCNMNSSDLTILLPHYFPIGPRQIRGTCPSVQWSCYFIILSLSFSLRDYIWGSQDFASEQKTCDNRSATNSSNITAKSVDSLYEYICFF